MASKLKGASKWKSYIPNRNNVKFIKSVIPVRDNSDFMACLGPCVVKDVCTFYFQHTHVTEYRRAHQSTQATSSLN
jgi:hypothetical protein